jgi:hypothetical protein
MKNSPPLKVFIDTEFTDFLEPDLISLGMAAESGEEFYGEVPYAHYKCSEFVKEVVLELLGKIPHTYYNSHYELARAIIQWLEIVRQSDQMVEICVDAQTDWDLFSHALDNRVPTWARLRHIGYSNVNELLRYEYHAKNGLPEHHALYDACANRYAFREPVKAN